MVTTPSNCDGSTFQEDVYTKGLLWEVSKVRLLRGGCGVDPTKKRSNLDLSDWLIVL